MNLPKAIERELDKKYGVSKDDDLITTTKYCFYNEIASQIEKAVEEVLSKIHPFDLVEECVPDCSPEQHAYHTGTWDAQLKLEKILSSLKGSDHKVKEGV